MTDVKAEKTRKADNERLCGGGGDLAVNRLGFLDDAHTRIYLFDP